MSWPALKLSRKFIWQSN